MTNRDELKAHQLGELNSGLTRLAKSNRFYIEKWQRAGVRLGPLPSWDAFAELPFTTKSELLANQAAHPPYGSNLTEPLEQYVRMHQTSGSHGTPLRWLDTPANWRWLLGCWEAIFDAAGLTRQDRMLFPFSFGPFLGFWAAFDYVMRHDYFAVAAGGLTSAARLEAIATHGISVVFCTPSYALKLAETAKENGFDLARTAMRALVLAGEPGASVPATRARIENAFGARVFDHSGMTEIGSLGLEFAELPGKPFLMEDRCIAECIDPKTAQPVEVGELGELVLTNLGRWDSPLIRYRTGDLVRMNYDFAPRGKPFVHLEGGILGRVDEMFFIRGNNVYPSAIEGIVRAIDGIREFAIDIVNAPGDVELRLRLEPEPAAVERGEALANTAATAIRDQLHFRPIVVVERPNTLPRFEMKAKRINIRPR